MTIVHSTNEPSPTMRKQVTVVIPIHREEPTELEKISLSQTLAVLGKHPITFQTKADLNTIWYEEFCRGKATVSFERFHWNGFDEYTMLMMSPEFYARFSDYEFMLICHLDAFVFRDELDKWCKRGYDYVGSVIYNTHWEKLPTRLGKLLGFVKPDYCANGGFGLRKISSFIWLSKSKYIKRKMFLWRLRHSLFHDDIFLAQLFPKMRSQFYVPTKEVAQQFGAAFEHFDEKNLPFVGDGKSLPFGIHGWITYHPDFWAPYLRQYGYAL